MRYALSFAFTVLCVVAAASAAEFQFRDQELPTRLTVGYAVRLLDMNGDQRLDIAIVDSDRILWLENPNWTEHVILQGQTKKDNVCFAPYDIDGDGRLDFAVGADWQPANHEDGRHDPVDHGRQESRRANGRCIRSGEYPTTHRMNFADLDGDGRQELIVSSAAWARTRRRPNFAEHGTPLMVFQVPADPVKGPWKPEVICDDVHVTHNFQVTDFNGDGKPDILLVSFEGVHLAGAAGRRQMAANALGDGKSRNDPQQGFQRNQARQARRRSGIHRDDRALARHQVVVYTAPDQPRPSTGEWLWKRQVLDEELKWGHAVWAVNLDGDDDQELVIGVRDNLSDSVKCGVRIYDPQDAAWHEVDATRLVDPGSVAVEDLTAGDLNGDGRTDIVAVGRATHNVKIYWNESK